jgi:drug/metabolite transporter (DMT)-like permease
LVAFIWGSTFVVVKEAVASLSTFWFLSIRFWLAFLVLLAIYYRQVSAALKSRAALAGAAAVGTLLALAYGLQTTGLTMTAASKAAFITGLYVVLVPILSTTLLGRPPGRLPVVGALAAAVGLAFLTLRGWVLPDRGDLWVLAGALAFAAHITAVGHFTRRQDSYALATLQVGAAAVVLTILALTFEPTPTRIPPAVWVAIAITGVLATALAMVLQSVVQRLTPPTHTALILATEPVFAALTSYLYLGEILSPRAILGALMMLAGMVLSELQPGESARQETPLSAAKSP